MDGEADRYRRAWRTLRRRIALHYLYWAGPFFFTFVINGVALRRTGHALTNQVVGAIFVAWATIFVVSGLRMKRAPCPRCGKAYSGWYESPFAKHCAHCGLARNSLPSDASSGAGTQ